MVSTRHHPRPFPEPDLPPSRTPVKERGPDSPTSEVRSTSKRRSTSTRRKSSSTPSSTAGANGSTAITPSKSSAALTRTKSTSSRRSRSSGSHFVHTPTSLSITWLLISLPLVIWDTGYVLLRPHSMPGGFLANPIWTPYALYGTVDYIYGFPAWNDGNGFTSAQASLNVVETLAYIYYLAVIARCMDGGFWSWETGALGKLWREGKKKELAVRSRSGRDNEIELAVLLCFSACVMTVSKTVLYWLNEAFSNFANIGHNKPLDLLFLWIIPNGAWLVLPSFMIVSLGTEILDGMRGVKSD